MAKEKVKEGVESREKYPKKVLARMTEEEAKILKWRAKEEGLSLSRYLVEAGLESKTLLSREQLEVERTAIFHVRKIGVNLNQMVKLLRMGSAVELRNLDNVLLAQANTLRALRDALKGKR